MVTPKDIALDEERREMRRTRRLLIDTAEYLQYKVQILEVFVPPLIDDLEMIQKISVRATVKDVGTFISRSRFDITKEETWDEVRPVVVKDFLKALFAREAKPTYVYQQERTS